MPPRCYGEPSIARLVLDCWNRHARAQQHDHFLGHGVIVLGHDGDLASPNHPIPPHTRTNALSRGRPRPRPRRRRRRRRCRRRRRRHAARGPQNPKCGKPKLPQMYIDVHAAPLC